MKSVAFKFSSSQGTNINWPSFVCFYFFIVALHVTLLWAKIPQYFVASISLGCSIKSKKKYNFSTSGIILKNVIIGYPSLKYYYDEISIFPFSLREEKCCLLFNNETMSPSFLRQIVNAA